MNEKRTGKDANRDPITGEPKSHPVGTGVGAAAGAVGGAAAGAATGAAIGTAGAGPIGTAVGGVAGALVGAAAGHATGESLNPTASPEEGRYIGYTVIDRNDEKAGTVESVWLDAQNEPAYLSIRTGWLGMGRTYVVPAQSASVRRDRQQIRLPYTLEQIKGAPEFDGNVQLQHADEDRIGSYYATHGFRREGWLEQRPFEQRPATGTAARAQASDEERRIQLKEEELKVGKREVQSGGVRLRKIVRTEVVNQPVELKREEIVIERVPASGSVQPSEKDFGEEEIFIPLRREEAVVTKEAHVREEVRVGKKETREQQRVSDTVRKEDVEIDKDVSESRLGPGGDRAKTPRYEPKERGRS